jgi:predicted ATP-grasp superfamily ATP-dependent carboligase
MYPALGGSSIFRESIPVPDDSGAAAEALVEAGGLTGYSEVEFRRDSGGRPVLMEINPRISASLEVAVRAGVDFPTLIYAWATGGPLVDVTKYRYGVKVRWLGGDVRWLVDTVRAQGRPDVFPVGRALWEFSRDFARRGGYDYMTRDDLRPAAIATWRAARSASRIAAKRLGAARR